MSKEITFGERLQKLREQRGWSMAILASKVGCSTKSVFNWEHGITTPQLDKVCDVAMALHTTVEAMCGRPEYCRSQSIAELKKENLRLKKALIKVRMANLDICDEIREVLFPDSLMEGEDE